jgi:hypothetical protein
MRIEKQRLTETLLAVFFWMMSLEVTGASVMVLGTKHFSTMDVAPDKKQIAHSVSILEKYKPTQVCIERMSGERIESLLHPPESNGFSFNDTWHGRPLAKTIAPMGVEYQLRLERNPDDARVEGEQLLDQWPELDGQQRHKAIGLLLAGYRFHDAVLNWGYLSEDERKMKSQWLTDKTPKVLDEFLNSNHEVYALALPLAMKLGLHSFCHADSQEDESAGIKAALENDGQEVLKNPEFLQKVEKIERKWNTKWRPESGDAALTEMLTYFNSDEFEQDDRASQWDGLLSIDNEKNAFYKRFMFWHARTAEISAEIYRALARGREERIILIIGAAHRPFTEKELRSQPWFDVIPAIQFLENETK